MQLTVWLPLHARRTDTDNLDFTVYRNAAARVAAGLPLYEGCAAPAAEQPPSCYLYPPPLAVALAPLASVSDRAFQAGWYAFLIVAFWAYAAGLARLAGRGAATGVLAAGLLLQVFPGTTVTMSFGNVDMAVWAVCAWALALGSGPLAGLAAAVKVYPGWLLLRRDRGALLGALAALGVLAATVPVVGLHAFVEWRRALAILSSVPSVAGNVSLPHLLGLHGTAATMLPLLGAPLMAFLARGLARPVRAGLVLAVSVLLAPLCWWYYAPILLLPAAALFAPRSAR